MQKIITHSRKFARTSKLDARTRSGMLFLYLEDKESVVKF